MARQIQLREDEIVVELGVGGGAITDQILPVLRNKEQYVGFELNDRLFKYLHDEKYPDLEIHHASAENLTKIVGTRRVGAVVSTLPWSLFSDPVRKNILDQIEGALVPGGTFCVFLALHVLWTNSAKTFWSELTARFPNCSYGEEVWNIPPCRLFFGRKSWEN